VDKRQIRHRSNRRKTTGWRKFSDARRGLSTALSGHHHTCGSCTPAAVRRTPFGEPVEAVEALGWLSNLTIIPLRYKPTQVISDITAGSRFSADLYKHYSTSLRKGIDSVFAEENPISDQLRANVARFAAYKTRYATLQLTEALIENKDKVKALLKKFDRWHDAEYATTVARSRTAKQFNEFMQPDSLRLFPNLRWLPSRSATVRVDHTAFYNRVWAKTDTFWATNSPGTEWNCKCDVEETDDPATNNANVKDITPPAGLEGNPAFTGEVFTEKASYIKKTKPFTVPPDQFKNLNTLVNNDTKIWRLDYYTDNEGMLQTSRNRIIESKLNKQELAKFEKEHNMSLTLAKNGHIIVYRETIEGSFDIFLDDKPAELKKTSGIRNIGKYAKKAIHKQDAEFVVFEFESESKEVYKEIESLKSKKIHGYYFFSKKKNKIYPF
jgi:hypothetical protein